MPKLIRRSQIPPEVPVQLAVTATGSSESPRQIAGPKSQSDLDEGARQIREQSELLSTRLRKVEGWLASLSWRVAATVRLPDPEKDANDLLVRFEREGSEWCLRAQWVAVGSEPTSQHWRRLTKDAPLGTKIFAVEALPSLFAQMHEAQSALVNRLRTANERIEQFAKSVSMPELEGA